MRAGSPGPCPWLPEGWGRSRGTDLRAQSQPGRAEPERGTLPGPEIPAGPKGVRGEERGLPPCAPRASRIIGWCQLTQELRVQSRPHPTPDPPGPTFVRTQPHLLAPGPAASDLALLLQGTLASHRALPCPQVARRQGPTRAGRCCPLLLRRTWATSGQQSPEEGEADTQAGRRAGSPPAARCPCPSRPPALLAALTPTPRWSCRPALPPPTARRAASLTQGHTAGPGTSCPFLGGPRPPWCHLGATPPKPLSGTILACPSLGVQLGLGLNPRNLSEPPFAPL